MAKIQNLNHLVEDKIDQNRINLIGIELEGYYDRKPDTIGELKSDGSLEGFDHHSVDDGDGDCNGECGIYDNCECWSECECEECIICDICNDSTVDCKCTECLICSSCEYKLESCRCDRNYHKLSSCTDPRCNELGVCEPCKEVCEEIFNENQDTEHNCSECNNLTFSCEQDCGCECDCNCQCEFDAESGVGEFVSEPLKVDEVEDWIYKSYPTKTNFSCGGHCHISLKSYSDYMNLMTKEFYTYYINRMVKWGKKSKINEGSEFWKRIEGKRYCKAEFNPEDQRDMKGHYDQPRYTHLNYCFNVNGRHTLEFRLLPCFQKDYLMVSGIKETISIVEDYLQNLPPNKNIKMRFTI